MSTGSLVDARSAEGARAETASIRGDAGDGVGSLMIQSRRRSRFAAASNDRPPTSADEPNWNGRSTTNVSETTIVDVHDPMTAVTRRAFVRSMTRLFLTVTGAEVLGGCEITTG